MLSTYISLIVWWCLTPLSTIFHSYRGISLFGGGNRRIMQEKTTDLSQVTDKLYHIMLYTSPWSRFELTTSVVIGTDCIGSCKIYNCFSLWNTDRLKLYMNDKWIVPYKVYILVWIWNVYIVRCYNYSLKPLNRLKKVIFKMVHHLSGRHIVH